MGTITLNKFIVKTTTSNATVSAIDGWAMKSTGVTIASVNIDTEALCENRSNSGLPPENRKSNGDISLNVITQTQQSSSKKIRRAFSMPRNPFRWSRKFKTNSTTTTELGCKTSSGLEERSKHGSIVSINSYTTTNLNQNPKKDKILMAAATTSGAVQTTGIVNSSEESTNQNKSESDFTGTSPSITGSTSVSNANNRIFRRSSFRKFLNRIAQHVSSTVNIGANKRASSQASSLAASDRVPPIGGYQWPPDQTPGVTGLKNHGNTCFMNAVLQCLSHTDILAEYFVLDQYKADLKRRNKINSRKFGTKGELTEQLANVLKALWTCKNESDHSTSFKAVVDRYGSQFRSSTQHDAQEFLFWLLDKVHEDLNTATKRRYKSVKNNYGRPDEVIAAETLANHIRCNNSFVQAVFQAQFRSSLTCPRCKKQSNTFDPFHCISVQLPQLTKQTIFVTVLYVKQHPRQVRYGLTVPAGSPITALRQQLQKDTGIRSNCMVLADINETGFSRVFYDTQPVSTLEGIDTIYCIEVPEMNGVTGATTEVNTSTSFDVSGSSSSSTDLMLLVANVQKKTDGSGVERFGTPFCLQAPRDCSYVELQKKILREMATILKPEVFAYSTPLSDMFQIRLQDPSADPDTYLDPVEHPLLTEMIDMALSVLSSETGPAHIKLLLEWTVPEDFFADLSDSVVEHESVARLRDRKKNDTSLTLEQCLEHYTKAETLSAEDAWRCPHCQQYLPVVKTLGLWSLPDILVVHFKRFRQHHDKGADAAKLTTMVKFPLNSFDMSPHLAKETSAVGAARSSFDSLSSNDCYQTSSRSPWRKTRDSNRSNIFGTSANTKDNKDTGKETRYDLYAVCYHQGDTLETGHYTAACKNPYDHQWYKFDDQRVSKVPSDSIHEEIINNEAYMLFYQRRKTDTVECSGSSSTSSDHWVSKIAVPLPVDRNTGTNAGVNPSQIAVDTISEKISEGSLSPVVVVAPVQKETKLQPSLTEPVKILDSATITDIVLEESGTQQAETKTTVIIEKTDECELVDIEEVEYADQDRSHHVNGIDVSQPNITSPDIDVGPIQFQMDEDLKVVNGFEDLHDTSDVMENISKTKIVFQPEPTTVQVKQHSPLINQKQMKSPPVIQSISFMPIKSKTPSPNDLTMKIKSPKTKPTEACISSSSSSSSSSSRSSRTSMSSPIPDTATATASAVPLSMSASRIASPLPSTKSKLHNHNYPGIPSTKYSGVNNNSFKEALSSSLKNNSSSIIGGSSTGFHDFSNASSSLCLNGSTHSGSASGTEYHCVSLRHSFSTSSNYKLKECSDTLSSMLRNTANTCSKDTLIFIDQQNHSLMEDDDSFLGSRSLWISPVTPHKLITVSPKN